MAGLISAITNANIGSDPSNTINLAAGGLYNLTAADNTDPTYGASGLPIIITPITINGNGSTIQRSTAQGTPSFRILFVRGSNAGLTLNGVTIKGGESLNGGGLFNDAGLLTINDSVVSNNTGQAAGGIWNSAGTLIISRSKIRDNLSGYYGAIWNNGAVLTLTDSTVSGNTSTYYRGGAIVNLAGQATLINSSVSGNTSDFAGVGGIWNWNASGTASLTVINSTISGNTGTGTNYAGGILNEGTLTLSNSTVSGNRHPTSGGGIYNVSGTSTLKNSIVTGNTVGANVPSDCSGTITSLGRNIAGDTTCAFAGTGDFNSTNPMLAPLASYGGRTQTHALIVGSPAIDSVPNANCTDASAAVVATDQRGVARPNGTACDRGAFEYQPAGPSVAGQFSFAQSVPVYNRGSRRWVRTLSFTNQGPALTAAAFVADSLSTGASMYLPDATTTAIAPVGSPYKELGPVGSGATVTFSVEFSIVGATPLSYTAR